MTRKSRPAAPKRKLLKPAVSAGASTPTLAGMPERGLKIGEAAEVLGVETYVLRFWETQFAFLKPRHSKTKHRFYHDRDLEVLRLIKRLLHEEGFTIAGANKYIRENGLENLLSGKAPSTSIPEPVLSSGEEETGHQPAANGEVLRVLSDVRRDLESLHKMLE
jgi:DNA-binding transcriptional MerR regulator